VLSLASGPLEVSVALDPFAIDVRRGRRLVGGLGLWAADGSSHDQFLQPTEGVIPAEELEPLTRLESAEPVAQTAGELGLRGSLGHGREARLTLRVAPERVELEYEVEPAPVRLGVEWEARPGERFTGLGARHGEALDQTGRKVRLGADRRYTGPDCPPDMLDVGGIPRATTRRSPGYWPAAATHSGCRPRAPAWSSTSATGWPSPPGRPPGRFASSC
jgi:hypothetical protein